MRSKAITRLLFVVAAILWVALLFTDLSVVFSVKTNIPPDIPTWLPGIIFNLYLLVIYYYYKLKIDRDENLNFVDLLWRVFATGLIATVVSLLLRLFEYLLGSTKLTSHIIYQETAYLINVSLIAGFLLASFMVWKRLILYQKSKWLMRLWTIFEYGLLLSLIYNSLNADEIDWLYDVLLGLFVVVGLVLSGNMKWVAYLNFRQKWTSLLLLLLTIFYLLYGFYTNSSQAQLVFGDETGFVDYRVHMFMVSIMSFVTIYAIFSFLVILFNLPTTSVFEQKLEEVVNFQRISQSIQTEQSEESVYNILLETSVSTVFADAAWLEIKNNAHDHRLFTYKISEKEADEIIKHLESQHVTGVFEQSSDKTRNLSKHLGLLRGSRFRSILAFPARRTRAAGLAGNHFRKLHGHRLAAVDHEVFGDDFDKIDRNRRLAVEEVGIMLAAQAEAEAVKRCDLCHLWRACKGDDDPARAGVGGRCRTPGRQRVRAGLSGQPRSPITPPFLRHLPASMALKPWPLHSFWPLQACSDVAQSAWTLQLLVP